MTWIHTYLYLFIQDTRRVGNRFGFRRFDTNRIVRSRNSSCWLYVVCSTVEVLSYCCGGMWVCYPYFFSLWKFAPVNELMNFLLEMCNIQNMNVLYINTNYALPVWGSLLDKCLSIAYNSFRISGGVHIGCNY